MFIQHRWVNVPRIGWRSLCRTVVVLTVVSGCSRSPSSSSGTPPAKPPNQHNSTSALVSPYRFEGTEFVAPVGWSIESVQGGLLILCPTIEADWQANIFIEARSDVEERSLDAALDALVPELQNRKVEFRESEREVAQHTNGFEFARLEYTCRDGSGVALIEWEIIIKATDNKRLFILASSASQMWRKYRPAFETFLRSVTLINE